MMLPMLVSSSIRVHGLLATLRLPESSALPLVAAPFIGFAFGWFLERGGLGHPRKLAAQFYLRDLTVFKVLFSALLTALLGTFWLGRVGLLDVQLIHVPETFLLPQLIGGAIFGIGFVLAGLCPGTSCVAAASGRVDGLAVMAGMLCGVLAFSLAYPRLAAFVESTPRGVFTIPDLLGAATGVVVFAVAVIAIGGFVVAERIEARRTTSNTGPWS